MSYLESNLGRDERIVTRAETSFLPLIPNAIAAGIVLVGIAGDIIVTKHFTGFFVMVAVIIALIILPKLLRIMLTELGVTSKKVIGKYGVVNTKVMDSPLGKVNSVSVEQGLGGKIFGYGKIAVSTSSGGYNFKFIKNPDAFRSAVMNQIEEADEARIRRQAEQLAGAVSKREQ